MSMYEQASKINERLKTIFDMLGRDGQPKEYLINAIIRFGQVAKFRCRSNSAYDNFCKATFKGIAQLERKQVEGQDFEALQIVKME